MRRRTYVHYPQRKVNEPLKSHRVWHRRSPMSANMKERAAEKRCVPTLQQTRVRQMVVRTWRIVNPMAMRMQQTGISLMAVGTRL